MKVSPAPQKFEPDPDLQIFSETDVDIMLGGFTLAAIGGMLEVTGYECGGVSLGILIGGAILGGIGAYKHFKD